MLAPFVLLCGIALFTNGDLWRDEATYYLALRSWSDLRPGVPLPLYEASAPWLVALLDHALIGLVGLTEPLLRLPSAIVFIAALATVQAAARRLAGRAGGIVAVLVAGSSFVALDYATQLKPWSLEMLAGALVLLLAIRVRADDRPAALVVFTAVSVALDLVSNTAVLVALPLAVGLLLTAWRTATPARRGAHVASAVVIGGAFAAWYLAAVAPANRYQLALPEYHAGPGERLALLRAAATRLAAPAWLPQDGTAGVLFGTAVLLLAVVGAAILLRNGRGRGVVVGGVLAGAGVLVAAAIGRFPVLSARNLLVALPLVAVLAAVPVALALRRVLGRRGPAVRRRPVAAIAALVVATALAAASAPAVLPPFEQVRALLASHAAQDCGSIVPYYLTSPNAVVYARPAGVTRRLVTAGIDPDSGAGGTGWEWRIRDHLGAEARTAVAAADRRGGDVCVVTGTSFPSELRVLLTAAAEDGPCRTVATDVRSALYDCARR